MLTTNLQLHSAIMKQQTEVLFLLFYGFFWKLSHHQYLDWVKCDHILRINLMTQTYGCLQLIYIRISSQFWTILGELPHFPVSLKLSRKDFVTFSLLFCNVEGGINVLKFGFLQERAKKWWNGAKYTTNDENENEENENKKLNELFWCFVWEISFIFHFIPSDEDDSTLDSEWFGGKKNFSCN